MITAYIFGRFGPLSNEVELDYVKGIVFNATIYGNTPFVYSGVDRDGNPMTIIALHSFEGHGIITGAYELWQSLEEYRATIPKCDCGHC